MFAGFRVGFTEVPFAERPTCGEETAGEGRAEPVLGFLKGLLELRLRDNPGGAWCSVNDLSETFAYQLGGRGDDNAARRITSGK